MTAKDTSTPFLPLPTHYKFRDLTGQTFGRLTALGIVERRNRTIVWLCACECGINAPVRGGCLTRGDTQSCGCLQQERAYKSAYRHGRAHTPIYNVWCSMRARCKNPKVKSFAGYGAKGITVCERWQTFENFLHDMGERPSPKHEIERVDGTKGYFPDNCIWATRETQANNKSTNHILTFQGKSQSIAMWARELHLTYPTIKMRIRNGWGTELALSTPRLRARRKRL